MREENLADIDGEVLDKIADVLLTLSEVSVGIYKKLHTDLPANHPIGALFQGVNEMIDALEREKQNNAAYQRELEEKLQTIERQRSSKHSWVTAPTRPTTPSPLSSPTMPDADAIAATRTRLLRARTAFSSKPLPSVET